LFFADESVTVTVTFYMTFRSAFYYVVIWTCLLFAMACLASVYSVIRRRELERGVYPRRGSFDVLKPRGLLQKQRNSSLVGDETFSIYTQNSFIVDNNSVSSSQSGAVSVVPDLLSFSPSWGSQQSDRRLDSSINSDTVSASERNSRRPSFLRTSSNRSNSSYNRGSLSLTGVASRARRQGSFTGSRREWLLQSRQDRYTRERQEAKEAEAVIRAISEIKSSTHVSSVARSYASRQVYEQALLYTVAFCIAYSFATINRVVQEVTGEAYFALMLLHVLFMPLQVSTMTLILGFVLFCFDDKHFINSAVSLSS
jgi:hypothetical protein